MARGTTAPEQEYPEIVEAPRSFTNYPRNPDAPKPAANAVDQTYPEIVPAPPVERRQACPCCGR